MPPTIQPPALRKLAVMAGAANGLLQLSSGLTQIPGGLAAFTTSEREELVVLEGQLIWNRQTKKVEVFTGTGWEAL